jgi:hypothetical protein
MVAIFGVVVIIINDDLSYNTEHYGLDAAVGGCFVNITRRKDESFVDIERHTTKECESSRAKQEQ